jgi:CO dehydrogenase/acetyl-CoA synthase alpha subunit
VTLTKAKLLWAGAMILVAWLFQEKKAPAAATGDVLLGVPIVNGVPDAPYYSKRGTVAAPDDTTGDPNQ